MAEEQSLHEAGGGHRLCANNCKFFGSQTTHNLCSKCYKDLCVDEQQMKEAKLVMVNTLTKQSHESQSSSSSKFSQFSNDNVHVCLGGEQKLMVEKLNTRNDLNDAEEQHVTPLVAVSEAMKANRCGRCPKRVGLIGFKCRCGVTFCGSHRYPEKHGCTFDFKRLGKEEISKANPIVIAKKLEKI